MCCPPGPHCRHLAPRSRRALTSAPASAGGPSSTECAAPMFRINELIEPAQRCIPAEFQDGGLGGSRTSQLLTEAHPLQSTTIPQRLLSTVHLVIVSPPSWRLGSKVQATEAPLFVPGAGFGREIGSRVSSHKHRYEVVDSGQSPGRRRRLRSRDLPQCSA